MLQAILPNKGMIDPHLTDPSDFFHEDVDFETTESNSCSKKDSHSSFWIRPSPSTSTLLMNSLIFASFSSCEALSGRPIAVRASF